MMSKRGGKQASVTIRTSSSSSGVSRQSTQPTISEYIQQTVLWSPDEVQSPLVHLSSQNTNVAPVMVSKRGGKETMIGKSFSSHTSAFNQHTSPETPDDFQSPLVRLNSRNMNPNEEM